MGSLSNDRRSLTQEPLLPTTPGGGLRQMSGASAGLKDTLTTFQQTFVMSDATKPDNPIMFASEGFYNMTGYTSQDVIGQNCRFLQGPDTDRAEVQKMKACLSDGQSYCGRLVNYRKDGSSFWNLLTISPVKADDGKVLKWIGMQVEVTKFTEGKADDAKRPNQLPVSLIRYDARQMEVAESNLAELVDVAAGADPETLAALPTVEEGAGGGAGEGLTPKTPQKKKLFSGLKSLLSSKSTPQMLAAEVQEEEEDGEQCEAKNRHGIDLATTLERIQKNFVITDPRLPDNPIIFASDDFLELTEYSREEIIGRNCRFLQGKDTDRATVQKIKDAIDNAKDITVQLLNYTKSGKPFWNLFHLQAVRDKNNVLQYFIGVQLDASTYVDTLAAEKKLDTKIAAMGTVEIVDTAANVGVGLLELPDGGQDAEKLWEVHSQAVSPLPHKANDVNWVEINKAKDDSGMLSLKNFRPIKPLGCGDTGSVHLVELRGTGLLFAMKAMEKETMVNRNKVHRASTEREILGMVDHPFLPTLYASFQTPTHVCLITDFCPGGELYMALENQTTKSVPEDTARFFAAEILLALEYLHCQGVVYRDLKPENILIAASGHLLLTDFDLSFVGTAAAKVLVPPPLVEKRKKSRRVRRFADEPRPSFVAEPSGSSNSFVGTEEYIAPEIISGTGHGSEVDWWAFGIFLFEMLYGKTPFRGKTRQKTFTNILTKKLGFPNSVPVSLEAKQLIAALLEKEPKERLGAHLGANEIKAHPFFEGVKWPFIRDADVPQLATPVQIVVPDIMPESARQSMGTDDENDWEDEQGRGVSLSSRDQ